MSKDFSIERKLTAVLSADVEGFSRLIEADEVGTLQNLASQRSILENLIARYRGRVVNTAGDSVLAEFPSVADAVQCAVDTQKAHVEAADLLPTAKRVLFRIGIHLGDVAVRGNDLLGNGVNIAARLQSTAPAGGIVISGSAHEQVRKILPLTFTDLGAQSVKNIEEPVRAFAVQLFGSASSVLPHTAVAKPLPLPDKPSIAVLPFQNMSGDPEQEYFADGMVEDIITALSRFKSLFVIARNSSFTYKGKAVDIKQVGRELGVRYVLEGSVQKSGGRVRITGQLIEAATGAHLWADRFDGAMEDVFNLQDQVSEKVAGTVGVAVRRAEVDLSVAQHTQDTTAYDCLLRGMSLMRLGSLSSMTDAIVYFKRSIEISPGYALAHAKISRCHCSIRQSGMLIEGVDQASEALHHARRALELDSTDPEVLCDASAAIGTFQQDLDRTIALCRRATELNPNHAYSWMAKGWTHIWRGEHENGVEDLSHALRISPLDPARYLMLQGFATASLLCKNFGPAFSWAERAYAERPESLTVLRTLAQCAAYAGNIARANQAVREALKISTGMSIRHVAALYRTTLPFKRKEDVETLLQGLRLAGLPEGAGLPSLADAFLPLPDKPSIAVLPFQNMSGDPEQEYFADGMVEDIITALSRKKGLFVIARNSSFFYKGKQFDIRQVGRELGVRYVLEGSVRKAGGKVRITGQLIEAATGAHLWADRYDGVLDDIFDLQDKITSGVVTAIAPQIELAEMQRAKRKPAENLQAYDYYLRGLDLQFSQQSSKAATFEAKEFWLRAVEKDPHFALAWAQLASWHIRIEVNGWGTDREADAREGVRFARHALSLDRNDPIVLTRAGFAIGRLGNLPDEGLALVEQATSLDPNLALAWTWSGALKGMLGEYDAAAERAGHALRLNPRDQYRHVMMSVLGPAHFVKGRYSEAAICAEDCLAAQPTDIGMLPLAVASYALAGRAADAKAAADRLLAVYLNFSAAEFLRTTRHRANAYRSKIVEGLRLAGLPE